MTNKSRKSNFYENKRVTKIDDIDVNKIVVSKEKPYGTKNSLKYFIQCNDNVIRPLWVKLSQMTDYVRKTDANATMSFNISNKQLKKLQPNMEKSWKIIENKI